MEQETLSVEGMCKILKENMVLEKENLGTEGTEGKIKKRNNNEKDDQEREK